MNRLYSLITLSLSILFNLNDCQSFFFSNFFGKKEVCNISLEHDFPNPAPLILKAQYDPEIFYPNVHGMLHLQEGDKLILRCLGNMFRDRRINYEQVEVKCHRKQYVKVGKHVMDFRSLECTEHPKARSRVIGSGCFNDDPNTKHIEVGFSIGKTFIHQYNVCFDDKTKSNVYSWYNSSNINKGFQKNRKRPFYRSEGFFDFQVHRSYYWKNELEVLSKILKSKSLAQEYIQKDAQKFLSRGQIVPKSDFVYDFEQAATMHYINTAPQWQLFNGGNWMSLEIMVQNLLKTDSENGYLIATGVHGISTLKDVEGKEQELYLYVDDQKKRIPVPKFFWKIVLDTISGNGIAFVGINNPFIGNVTDDLKVCKNICKDLDWIEWDMDDPAKGYVYCCNMDEFLEFLGDVIFLE